jgi:hypothetical protein
MQADMVSLSYQALDIKKGLPCNLPTLADVEKGKRPFNVKIAGESNYITPPWMAANSPPLSGSRLLSREALLAKV